MESIEKIITKSLVILLQNSLIDNNNVLKDTSILKKNFISRLLTLFEKNINSGPLDWFYWYGNLQNTLFKLNSSKYDDPQFNSVLYIYKTTLIKNLIKDIFSFKKTYSFLGKKIPLVSLGKCNINWRACLFTYKTQNIFDTSNRFIKNTINDKPLTLLLSELQSSKPLKFYNSIGKKILKNDRRAVSIVVKQKRVDRTKFTSKLQNNYPCYIHKNNKFRGGVFYKDGGIIKPLPDYSDIYKKDYASKFINKNSFDNILSINKSYPNQKRLLWVNKQIILPTHMAITIITNSYDVIHSWFVPGLGLKMDCVPGRSTHHTIYIEYGGYYYGQCAEVCGRRHHHMPIKIFAVPFAYFSYWWTDTIKSNIFK